jgi:hypothetical protein
VSYRTDLIGQSKVFRALSRFNPASQFDWFDIWQGHIADTLIRLLESISIGWALVLLTAFSITPVPHQIVIVPVWRPPTTRMAGRHPAAP